MLNMYLDKHMCTGCTACVEECPVKAIKLEENEKGFLYPNVNESLCVECGKCKNVCQIENKATFNRPTQVFAVKNKSDDERKTSSSGGVFSVIAKAILAQGGVVYACAYDDSIQAKHVRIESLDKIEKCKGSKYVQSFLGDTFISVKEDLSKEKFVLFVGTPCQVRGLKLYLKTDFEKLITVDFVCHGVPSPGLFKQHIEYVEKKRNRKIVGYHNRSKVEGWGNHIEVVTYDTKKTEYKTVLSQAWKRIFYSHCCLRESCYSCEFASLNRVSEITMGDYWGIEKTHLEFKDALGVSIVLINNEKGLDLFNRLQDKLIIQIVNDESYVQQSLREPVKKPTSYEQFWHDYSVGGYHLLAKKYARCSVYGVLKETIKKVVYRRTYIP